jgi:hypothetical protein
MSAPLYAAGMGKGLREPVSPFREAYFFGAELNVPNADNWNYYPQIVEAGNAYNLAGITPYHEVAVYQATFFNIYDGGVVTIRWKKPDGTVIYTTTYSIPDPSSFGYDYWSWYYVYSYIGYVPWEIYSNGTYSVELYFDGVILESAPFSITGVTEDTGNWYAFSHRPRLVIASESATGTWYSFTNKPVLTVVAQSVTGNWYSFANKPVLTVVAQTATGNWYSFANKPVLSLEGTEGGEEGASILPAVLLLGAGVAIVAIAASPKAQGAIKSTYKKVRK